MDMRTFVSMPVALRVRAQMTGIPAQRNSRRRSSTSSSSTEDESDSVNTSRPTTQSTAVSAGDQVVSDSRTVSQATTIAPPARGTPQAAGAVIALESSPSPVSEPPPKRPSGASKGPAHTGFNFDAGYFQRRLAATPQNKTPCVPRSGPGAAVPSPSPVVPVGSPAPAVTSVSRPFSGIGDLFSSIFGDTSAVPVPSNASEVVSSTAFTSPSRPPLVPTAVVHPLGTADFGSSPAPRRSARGGPPSHSSASADSSGMSFGTLRARSEDRNTPPAKQHRRW